MNDKILKWFIQGETGISSKALAAAVCGLEPDETRVKFGNHPADPDDFKRCVKFLDSVPEARLYLNRAKALSEVWTRLVEHWDELESLFREEYPTKSAPRLYSRMKELGC